MTAHKRYISASERAKEIARGAFLWATLQDARASYDTAEAHTAWESWGRSWPELMAEAKRFQALMFDRALQF